jgi:hypothetical protein
MGKDLFGQEVESPKDPAKDELKLSDHRTFDKRLIRLKYINTIYPFGQRQIFGSNESYKIFHETIECFIAGQFIATIILSQCFIERRIQEYFGIRMDERTNFTLNQLLKDFKSTGFIDEYFIERIDRLRLKRNPFVHRKDPLSNHSLMQRAFMNSQNPDEVLFTDAKEALSLMFIISQFKVL